MRTAAEKLEQGLDSASSESEGAEASSTRLAAEAVFAGAAAWDEQAAEMDALQR